MTTFIIFDLDNTLYSARYGLEERVGERIRHYMAAYLGVSVEEAAAERKKRIELYGTTVEWLLAEKGFSPGDVEDFYRAIHPEDEVLDLGPDPGLKSFLKSLPCPLAILTNSPMEHARRVLERLEIEDCFSPEQIFDMRRLHFCGKPREDAFRLVLDSLGAQAEEVLFVDDVPRYVEGFLALRGRGLLLDEEGQWPDYPHEKIARLEEIKLFCEF